jgi:NAD(P)-dependent dehydrogenase (short-subunit alcohol dehydrogenase family)
MTARIGTSVRPDWGLAVVVGAGGMGMAVARRLSDRRRVLLVDIDAGRAEAGAEDLRRGGGDARAIACDVTDPVSVAALARTVADQGGFQVLAHVAALAPATADFDQIIRVNLTGAALVADALRPLAQVGTAAVLVSSVAGHNVRPAAAADDLLLGSPTDPALARKLAAVLAPEEVRAGYGYILSKYAIIAYCRRQAAAWGERGARIVSLSPGLIATPMGAATYEKFPEKMRLFERTPLKREGTMLEIADAVEFLASDRASFISGTDLLVDGGLAGAQGNG